MTEAGSVSTAGSGAAVVALETRLRWKRPLEALATFLGVFLLFAGVTAVFFWQWAPTLHSALIGPPSDHMLEFWNSWYVAVAKHPQSFFFTDLIRFPEGTPLYYHAFAYPKLLLIFILSKIFSAELHHLIFFYNVNLLISFPIAGVGAFYLVRHFTKNAASAILGGFIFAFNPSHIEYVMCNMSVSSIEFIPIFVICYLRAIEKKSLILLIVAICLYALNALLCWYYLFYIAYFLVFHTIYIAIRDRSWSVGWPIVAAFGCLAGVVVLLSPLLVPMVQEALVNDAVNASGYDIYVADVTAYIMFPEYHILVPSGESVGFIGSVRDVNPQSLSLVPTWPARILGNVVAGTVYLGLVNIEVLTLLWFRARNADARVVRYVIIGMLIFCVLASGASLHVFGHRTIPMPDAVLSQLPFFRNVRTPSRAIVFTYLFLAIGVGQAAAALAWRNGQSPIARWGMALAAALMVLDFYPAHPLATTAVTCSSGLAIIRDDPEQGFGVLDLPSSPTEGYIDGNFYMMQQTCHSRPIVQGNTSRNLVVSLRDRLEMRDLEAQRRQLSVAKVKYIIIHSDRADLKFPWPPEDAPRETYTASYPVVFEDPEMTVLRVY